MYSRGPTAQCKTPSLSIVLTTYISDKLYRLPGYFVVSTWQVLRSSRADSLYKLVANHIEIGNCPYAPETRLHTSYAVKLWKMLASTRKRCCGALMLSQAGDTLPCTCAALLCTGTPSESVARSL